MNPNKIRRLRLQLHRLRSRMRAGIPSQELERLALALGRRQHKRGKEPAWVSDEFPDLRPVSIPHHSKPIYKWTAGSILDQLEHDLERLEEKYGAGEEEQPNETE